jgi:hypothetical protein
MYLQNKSKIRYNELYAKYIQIDKQFSILEISNKI